MQNVFQKKEIDYVKIFGPNGNNVAILLNQLSNINWFSHVGTKNEQVEISGVITKCVHVLNEDMMKVQWTTKQNIPSLVDGSSLETIPMYTSLDKIRIEIYRKVVELNRDTVVFNAVNQLAEEFFHNAYEGAFREFEAGGENVVKTACTSAIYIVSLACAWEAIADVEGFEINPFLSLIKVYENGHWPVGIINHQFFVI